MAVDVIEARASVGTAVAVDTTVSVPATVAVVVGERVSIPTSNTSQAVIASIPKNRSAIDAAFVGLFLVLVRVSTTFLLASQGVLHFCKLGCNMPLDLCTIVPLHCSEDMAALSQPCNDGLPFCNLSSISPLEHLVNKA